MPFILKPFSRDPDDIEEYLRETLREFEEYLRRDPRYMQLEVSHVPPGKFFNGMIVLADGTDWDPGSGEGYYGYYNGQWNYLG